jgi:hypothetical protein
MKIIYKIIDGIPLDIAYSRKVPDGFLSIELDKTIRKIKDVDWESIKTEAAKKKESIENQRKTCKRYLNETQYLVSNDTPYPADLGKNKALRVKWRAIMKSDVLQKIPKKIADS